jgi:hypothetical protein
MKLKNSKDKFVIIILLDRSERYFSTPLYESKKGEEIRNCRTGCENPFCD